jgi:hypothetical protein
LPDGPEAAKVTHRTSPFEAIGPRLNIDNVILLDLLFETFFEDRMQRSPTMASRSPDQIQIALLFANGLSLLSIFASHLVIGHDDGLLLPARVGLDDDRGLRTYAVACLLLAAVQSILALVVLLRRPTWAILSILSLLLSFITAAAGFFAWFFDAAYRNVHT